MAELEIVPEVLTEAAPDEKGDLGRIADLITGDSAPLKPDAGVDPHAAVEPPDPVEIPESEPEPAAAVDDDDPPVVPEIDYDQAIPMPDGAESVTVGQLKDHYQGKADFENERDSWESHRMGQDNQLIAAKRELMEVAQMVGKVNPELLNHLQQQRQANQAQQKELLLGIFPEWADPAVKKAASPALIATAKAMGYSEVEFAHIDDYRHIKVLSDLSKYQAREKAGLEKREAVKVALPKGQKSVQRKQTKAQERAAKINRAKDGTETEKLGAIGALIDGA